VVQLPPCCAEGAGLAAIQHSHKTHHGSSGRKRTCSKAGGCGHEVSLCCRCVRNPRISWRDGCAMETRISRMRTSMSRLGRQTPRVRQTSLCTSTPLSLPLFLCLCMRVGGSTVIDMTCTGACAGRRIVQVFDVVATACCHSVEHE
jgi:hypothetical protein